MGQSPPAHPIASSRRSSRSRSSRQLFGPDPPTSATYGTWRGACVSLRGVPETPTKTMSGSHLSKDFFELMYAWDISLASACHDCHARSKLTCLLPRPNALSERT